jgi:hypothetical protein
LDGDHDELFQGQQSRALNSAPQTLLYASWKILTAFRATSNAIAMFC